MLGTIGIRLIVVKVIWYALLWFECATFVVSGDLYIFTILVCVNVIIIYELQWVFLLIE